MVAGASPKPLAQKGWNALMVAVAAGHSDIVKTLLDVTADPNTWNGDGFTPLIMASTKGFAGRLLPLYTNHYYCCT